MAKDTAAVALPCEGSRFQVPKPIGGIERLECCVRGCCCFWASGIPEVSVERRVKIKIAKIAIAVIVLVQCVGLLGSFICVFNGSFSQRMKDILELNIMSWSTPYRPSPLDGDVMKCCRELRHGKLHVGTGNMSEESTYVVEA